MVHSDTGLDLGVGSSAGPAYSKLVGPKSLTLASLLAPRDHVRFVPAQKTTAKEEIPYEAINLRKPVKAVLSTHAAGPSSSTTVSPAAVALAAAPSPFFPLIDPAVGWARAMGVGKGLENLGNTCFLNSALQVLLHTAPLVRYLTTDKHDVAKCQVRIKKTFCMTCTMKQTMDITFKSESRGSFSPRIIVSNLRKIAQTMRPGRQEDSHEFLRFCIDAMQNGCLFGKSPKLDIKIKESTFVHQIFGGRLRSRVTCSVCKQHSDTFDSILDLSLDVQRCDSIKDALATFVKVDQLKGNNKYKCEKCKKLVNAEKSFTIEQAPMVLTIHLKRFTAGGKKIGDTIKYPEQLNLSPYMSNRAQSPSYRLFGVINHSGGGPHSGHYTANVKSAKGTWYHMNDDSVTASGAPPLNARSAYVLFYCREKGDTLAGVINGSANSVGLTNEMSNGKKRGRESEGGATGEADTPSKKSFVGPQHLKSSLSSPRPPQIVTASKTSPVRHSNPFLPAPTSPSLGKTNPFLPPSPAPPYVSGSGTSEGGDRKSGLFRSKKGQLSQGGKGKIKLSMVGSLKPKMIRS